MWRCCIKLHYSWLGVPIKQSAEYFLIVMSSSECNNVEKLTLPPLQWGPPGIPSAQVRLQLEFPSAGFLSGQECDCLITAFGPRGAVVECRVINPICTLGHTPGI